MYKHPVNPATLGSRWHDPKRKALHLGDDYRVGLNTVVRAIESGRVVAVAQHKLWGFVTQVQHADGRVSSYHQLQRGGRPALGSTVQQGQQVGRVGQPLNDLSEAQREANSTWAGQAKVDAYGNRVSTGPHLHLGILNRLGGSWVNPATIITTTQVASSDSQPLPEDNMSLTSEERTWLNQAAQRAGWAADYVAVGEAGVRNDGQLAALVRRGVNAAEAAQKNSEEALKVARSADQKAGWAADYVATAEPNKRPDGQLAALVRRGVTAAENAAKVDTAALAKALIADPAFLAAVKPAALSDADKQDIAKRTADELYKRLAN